jgi:LysR family transcriptional activator of nhaA
MDGWLNYHHLYYFSVIAEEGALVRAAARLHLTHSTLSAQLKSLEGMLGAPLFYRRGRSLELTELGAEVAEYAADIFRLGRELVDVAKGRAEPDKTRLRIGVVAAIPRQVAVWLLEPVLAIAARGSLHVRQDSQARLVEDLAAHRLHVVLSDAIPAQATALRLHAHALGACEIAIYGSPELARRHGRRFPARLDGAPMILPAPGSSLRRRIDHWLAEGGIRVDAIAEVDDAGLLRALGVTGRALFPVREALADELEETHGMVRLGRLDGVRETYYAIACERRITASGVAALIESARARLTSTESVRTRSGRRARSAAPRSRRARGRR